MPPSLKHGAPGVGQWSHCRWCTVCDSHHGALYNCRHYPESVRAEIAAQSARYRANLNDPIWIERQVRNGVPPEVIAIFQALAA